MDQEYDKEGNKNNRDTNLQRGNKERWGWTWSISSWAKVRLHEWATFDTPPQVGLYLSIKSDLTLKTSKEFSNKAFVWMFAISILVKS